MKHIQTFENFLNESKVTLSSFLDEIILLAAEYTDEDLESLSGQVPTSANDAVKMVLDYIPTKDKKKFLSRVDKIEQPKGSSNGLSNKGSELLKTLANLK